MDKPRIEPMRKQVMESPEEYPMLSQWTDAMWNSPFMRQYEIDGQKFENGQAILEVQGTPMGHAVWNLILTKRDLSLYANTNMKPHRKWKVSDVKWYFGIKGTKQTLLQQFMLIFDVIHGGEM
jgi:hypothetical protein